MTKIEQNLIFIFGLLLFALGAYVAVGWLIVSPAMVKIVKDSNAIVFNTALCFSAVGGWLLLRAGSGLGNTPSRQISLVLITVLILLPAIVLAEIILGIDLYVDQTALHRLVLDRNSTPGRMAVNTCVGFIAIGSAFLLATARPSRQQRAWLYTFGTLTFALGLSTLLGYVMELDWLYLFASFNRMALGTAAGMMLAGLALNVIARSSTHEHPSRPARQDIKLTRVAAVIVVLLALTSGMAGFITLKQGSDKFLQNELLQKAIGGGAYITNSLKSQIVETEGLLSFPVFRKDLETLPLDPANDAVRDHFGKVVDVLMTLGFTGLQLHDAAGAIVYTRGGLIAAPELVVPFKFKSDDPEMSLIFDNGFVLHVEKPIEANGAVIGRLIIEQKLEALDGLVAQLRSAGATSDIGLCTRAGVDFVCFPTRFITHTIHIPMYKDGQPAFPMTYALQGETGIIYANDVRGHPILAAYTPVDGMPLGLVIKVETTEFYGFVRERLNVLFGVLALLVGIGLYMLWSQLRPLAARLVLSEQKMRAANDVLEDDTERLSQIVAIQHKIAMATFDVSSSLQTIVENVQKLTRSNGAVVELINGDELFYRATSGNFLNFTGFRLKIAGSLSGHTIASRVAIRCDDTETDPRVDKVATRKLNIRSMVLAPLLHDGEVIGVLKSASSQVKAFTVKDEQALQLLSGLIGTAISQQQDYEDKQRLLSERTRALSELERTSDILRISEERTRIVIDGAYDAFVGIDGQGRVTDWNRQSEQIFGWTRAEAMGQFALDLFIAPSYRPVLAGRLATILDPAYRADGNQRFEIETMRRSGETFVAEMSVTPIHTGDTVMLSAFLHDVTDRRRAQEKLKHQAQYDALTGIPNRSLFMDRLGTAILRASRTAKPMALLYLDLDGFKKINDNYGHPAGDALLQGFADRLGVAVRKTDTVARLAGDEFAIILEGLTNPAQEVQMIATKVIAAMLDPINIGGGEKVIMTTSIGIAVGIGADTIDDLIHRADVEMYKAKKQGKNCFSLSEA